MEIVAANLECLKPYVVAERLGDGTVGVVFKLRSPFATFAAKLQPLHCPRDIVDWDREIQAQLAFYPFAPRIHSVHSEVLKGVVYGVIIMELMSRTLDVHLSTRRSSLELGELIQQLSAAMLFMRDRQFTHGDLAFFNIAFTQDNRLVFIDFDRSSLSLHRPHVDVLRLGLELAPDFRSEGSANLHSKNVSFLQKYGLPVWEHSCRGVSKIKELRERELEWETHYEIYIEDRG